MTRKFDTSVPQFAFVGLMTAQSVAGNSTSEQGSYKRIASVKTPSVFFLYNTSSVNNRILNKFKGTVLSAGDPPSDWVENRVSDLIKVLDFDSISIDFLSKLTEGGALIEFSRKDQFFSVEVFNDEDIVLLVKYGDTIKAWDLDEQNFIPKVAEQVLNREVYEPIS